MIEEWRHIRDTEYEVSNYGNIRRLSNGINTYSGRLKSIGISSNGYLIFGAFKDGKRTNILVHRAVVEAFIEKIPKGMEVNHKDGNKLNNRVDNLEIVTKSQNQRHAIAIGLSDINKLQQSKRYYGDDHWTHKHPELIAKGSNNGSIKHPEKLMRGEQCKSSKLKEVDVIDIRNQYKNNISIKELSIKYNVTIKNIKSIVNEKSWRHIL